MNDKDFEKLASTFGFAPSRALRELLDAATAQAALDEREACAKLVDTYEKAASLLALPPFGLVFKDCSAVIRARSSAASTP